MLHLLRSDTGVLFGFEVFSGKN